MMGSCVRISSPELVRTTEGSSDRDLPEGSAYVRMRAGRRGAAGNEVRVRVTTTVTASDKLWVEERGLSFSDILSNAIAGRREVDGSVTKGEPRWQAELRLTMAQRAGAGLTTPPEKFEEMKRTYRERWPEEVPT